MSCPRQLTDGQPNLLDGMLGSDSVQIGLGGREPDRGLGQLGQLQAEFATLHELSGIVTHDLSNPLQSLTVFLELALEDAASPHVDASTTQTRIEQCIEATARMRRILRDFSRCTRNSIATLSCDELLTNILSLTQYRLEHRGIRIHRQTDLLKEIVIDHPQIQFALLTFFVGVLATAETSPFTGDANTQVLKLQAEYAKSKASDDEMIFLSLELGGIELDPVYCKRTASCLEGCDWTFEQIDDKTSRFFIPTYVHPTR